MTDTPPGVTALDEYRGEDEQRAVYGLELAERLFTPERRTAVAQFLAIQGDDPALIPYLATCASYGLDPIMGHVWLIPVRMKVRDAEGKAAWEDRYRPAIGRDGLLHLARQRPEYIGHQAQVVFERDVFEVKYEGRLDDPQVLHQFASKPTRFAEGEHPEGYRGRLIGAWCKVFVKDRPAMFYYARLKEHGKFKDNAFEGAWGYTSTMILKSAQSVAHRLALGITGFVPVDELGDQGLQGDSVTREDHRPVETFDWDAVPEEVRDSLRAEVERANEMEPGSWGAAKCQMVLSDQPPERLEQVTEDLKRENALRENPPEPAAEPVDATVVPSEEEMKKLQEEEVHLERQIADARESDDAALVEDLEGQLSQVRDALAAGKAATPSE